MGSQATDRYAAGVLIDVASCCGALKFALLWEVVEIQSRVEGRVITHTQLCGAGITAVRICQGDRSLTGMSTSAVLQAAAVVLQGIPLILYCSEYNWDAASWPKSSLRSVARALTTIESCYGTIRPADGDWNRLLAMEALTEG